MIGMNFSLHSNPCPNYENPEIFVEGSGEIYYVEQMAIIPRCFVRSTDNSKYLLEQMASKQCDEDQPDIHVRHAFLQVIQYHLLKSQSKSQIIRETLFPVCK